MKKILMWVAAAMTLALAGCGGGGGSSGGSGGNPAVAGFYTGTTNTNRTVNALTSQFGDLFVFYSEIGAPTTLGGIVVSTSSSVSGNTVNDFVRDISIPGGAVSVGTLTATVIPSTSASGTATYTSGNTYTFTATRNATSTATASLSAISGSYTGTTVVQSGTATGTVTISSAGVVAGSVPGCTYSGTATPRTDGLNAFNLRIVYAAGCPTATTVDGAAFYDSSSNRLFAAGFNSDFTADYIFIGGPRVP